MAQIYRPVLPEASWLRRNASFSLAISLRAWVLLPKFEFMARNKLQTLAVHAGERRDEGGLSTPIHRSSTYELGEPETFDDIRYIRLNNTPTQRAVEAKLGALEGGAALVTPSGTSAIHLVFAAMVKPGGLVIAPAQIYGGTRKLLLAMENEGRLRVHWADMAKPASWPTEADVFYVEAMTNPWLEVLPHREIVGHCQRHGIASAVDNTFLSPALFRALDFGFDVVVHSATKILNGHTDLVAGAVAASEANIGTMRRKANLLGICPDPQMCWLLMRGLKTLPLRAKAQCDATLWLARQLQDVPGVASVRYPGLEDDPGFAMASELFDGPGHMITFEVASNIDAKAMVARLRLFTEAPSLGGVESLVTRPTSTSHAGFSEAEQAALGINERMVRISVGLEDPEDLLEDLRGALQV